MARLLFMSHCYPMTQDDMRGSFFLPLVGQLAKKGIEVDVLTPSWEDASDVLSVRRGLSGEQVWRFPWQGQRLAGLSLMNPRSMVDLFRFMNIWRNAVWEMTRRQRTWDVVLAAWGIPAGLLMRTRTLRRLPGAIWWLGTDFNRFDAPWFAPLLRWVATGSKENWANSRRIVSGLMRRAGVSAKFVPLQAVSSRPCDKGDAARANLSPRLLSVGRLEPVKGFDIGIRAVSELSRRGLKLEYRLVGEGPQRDALAKLINSQGNIKLLGYLDNVSLGRELAMADIVVIPSRQEGMPLVFFEALAAGKPVVATDVGDIRQCLEGTQLGLVSQPDDVSALADNIERACSGAVSFNVREAQGLLSAYGLDNTVSAVCALFRE